jgi:molybdopterin synthase catalytic subunit
VSAVASCRSIDGVVPESGDNWIALSTDPLPLQEVPGWVVRPDCGAVVTFMGTVRDHAEGRPGVTRVDYEAYEEHVVSRLQAIAAEARQRWGLGRVALLHRTGSLQLTECSVVVAVSAPHRGEAFEAARFCIDTLKQTVPIWKAETWEGGTDWGRHGHPVESPMTAGSPTAGGSRLAPS